MVRGELHPQSPVEHEAYRTDHGATEGLKLHREDPTLNHQHVLMTEHVSLSPKVESSRSDPAQSSSSWATCQVQFILSVVSS